jgi:phenylpyruvate tautomerase PptA (4-oxalocrotonate tautomerase family)
MPSTRIETRAGWINGRHQALIDAVQSALIESIRIPPADRDIRILEYPAEAFAPPAGRAANAVLIEISMFRGRSVEAKRRLYAALSRELAVFGVTGDNVKVLIHDVDRENWGLGGVSFADRDPGFKIDV